MKCTKVKPIFTPTSHLIPVIPSGRGMDAKDTTAPKLTEPRRPLHILTCNSRVDSFPLARLTSRQTAGCCLVRCNQIPGLFYKICTSWLVKLAKMQLHWDLPGIVQLMHYNGTLPLSPACTEQPFWNHSGATRALSSNRTILYKNRSPNWVSRVNAHQTNSQNNIPHTKELKK